jgi:glycosyltransferase involved in cell wall biosynthesis
MNYPKISIVTPSFNQGQFIEQTILSVLEQNYPNLEYIIIDGGSTDSSVKIIRKYEKFLAYWVSEPDKGQSDAINKGLLKCTGEIFNWLNSDDYYEPNAFFKIAEGFSNKNTLAVCGFQNRVDGEGNILNKNRTQIFDSKYQTMGFLLYEQLGTFLRFSTIEKLGNLNVNLHYAMDLEWWFKFLLFFDSENILMIDHTIANFRVYPNSKTGSKDSQLYNELLNIFYKFLNERVERNYISKFLKTTNTKIIEEYTQENNDLKMRIDSAQLILNYFAIHKAEINYASSHFLSCLEYLKLIDLNNSPKSLKKTYQKLLFRSRYLFPIIYLKQILNNLPYVKNNI